MPGSSKVPVEICSSSNNQSESKVLNDNHVGRKKKPVTKETWSKQELAAIKADTCTKRAVQEYYEANLTELPDAKHVSKRSLKKTRDLDRRRPIKALYQSFITDHPTIKVGVT